MAKNSRKQQVFDFIVAYKVMSAGMSPSVAEIAKGVGLKSKGNIPNILMLLKKEGKIGYLPGKARSISVVGARWTPPVLPAQKAGVA